MKIFAIVGGVQKRSANEVANASVFVSSCLGEFSMRLTWT